jgi:hypothetical protein
MNWAWADSLDHVWRSPGFPVWLTLAAAGFFGVIVLLTLLRAEKSVAKGVLTVIAILAVGIAGAATIRGFDSITPGMSAEVRSPEPAIAALPALSCIDDLAGEAVLNSCEKVLFGSAESTAAAVSYAASQISRLAAFGEVTATSNDVTPELQALRHAIEHDRYGLMAYVLAVRDHCTPSDCAVFRALTDRHQIVANMDERVYDGLISRYAPTWNAPPAPGVAPVAALIPGVPTGKPTNADFPSAASTPPVSIMTPEPGVASTSSTPRAPAPAANTPSPSPRPASATSPALAAAKKQPAPKPVRTPAPVSLAPASAAPPANAAPAASND